ncbi:MAG: alpha/beta hydrolase [Bacteroidia bacterium]|nr:alpha/beta hydrolase [Bacteroidia bacterium]
MKVLIIALFLSFSFCVFSQTKQKESSKPFVLGNIEEIQSTQLGEKRILNIYLPEGYKQDDTTKYSVIYLLDGSADEDFIHVVGLVQFNTFEWIKRIPKSIVVGIATVDRKRDFTYPTTVEEDKKAFPTTGHSDNFIAFIEKELQPYIEKKYKTNTSKTIIGQSLGGLFATEVLFKKPNLFNKYVIISPSLWWDDGSLLKQTPEILNEKFSQPTDIYIGVGKEGLGLGKNPHVMEVDANILAEKIKNTKSNNVSVYFDYLPQENHATVSHLALFNAFRLLYPAKK